MKPTFYEAMREAFAGMEAVEREALELGWSEGQIERFPHQQRWRLRVGAIEVYEAGVIVRGGNTPGDGQASIDEVVSRRLAALPTPR